MRFLWGITLLCSGAPASRKIFSDSKSDRTVEIYTWGNPKTSENNHHWPRQGCFEGLRAENEDYRKDKKNIKDVVSWIMSTYRHPEMKTIRLFDRPEMTVVEPCHWSRRKDDEAKGAQPIIVLHDDKMYINRSMTYGGRIGVMADIGLRYLYEPVPDTKYIAKKGWNWVDTASYKTVDFKEEHSHLYQNKKTLECILSFEGTDRPKEWLDNINVAWKTFCGNGFFHSGFRNVLLQMVLHKTFQEKIRPKLGACSKLSVVGHSLGGACAIMYAGCIQSHDKAGRRDYENLKFTWRKAELLPAK